MNGPIRKKKTSIRRGEGDGNGACMEIDSPYFSAWRTNWMAGV
jgi:hypothetical protein